VLTLFEVWTVATEHLPKLPTPLVNTPLLVGTGDEFAIFVPALDPSHAIVTAKEDHVDLLSVWTLDIRVTLAGFIFGLEHPAFQGSGVADGKRFVERFAIVFIFGNQKPSTAFLVFVPSWYRLCVMLADLVFFLVGVGWSRRKPAMRSCELFDQD